MVWILSWVWPGHPLAQLHLLVFLGLSAKPCCCRCFCCEFGKRVILQDIKSRIGFVVGFVLLNPSEALTNRWGPPQMHFSSLCSWSSLGKEIVAPRDVECKCNSLLGTPPWKLERFLLFSYTWSASHPLLPTEDADPCMSVAFSWWRCHQWKQDAVCLYVSSTGQIFLYSSLLSRQQFSVCFHPTRCSYHIVNAAFIFVSVYMYVCLYIEYILHIYMYLYACV